MRTPSRRAAVVSAVILLTVTWLQTLRAETYRIVDTEQKPFVYSECYRASDSLGPGPAAYFGQNVCVDYSATGWGEVRVVDKSDGTRDVHWTRRQHGTAAVYGQREAAILYEGYFQIEETADDWGNDAGCLGRTDRKDGDKKRVWAGNCDALDRGIDFLSLSWQNTDGPYFSYELSVIEPGLWCAIDSEGGAYGPGCF
jgi:hypothetical protein